MVWIGRASTRRWVAGGALCIVTALVCYAVDVLLISPAWITLGVHTYARNALTTSRATTWPTVAAVLVLNLPTWGLAALAGMLLALGRRTAGYLLRAGGFGIVYAVLPLGMSLFGTPGGTFQGVPPWALALIWCGVPCTTVGVAIGAAVCVTRFARRPPQSGRCAVCGYDIRLLPTNRCPECGNELPLLGRGGSDNVGESATR